MANTQEVFSELFAYVLLFEQISLQGGFQPSYEQVRSDIKTLLEQQAAAARRQGILEQDYQSARFAVIAWADETILKYTTWEHHRQWSAFPLQLEYYQTRDAGEELFERLESLRADQQEIREIYYLCLGLGFSGRYFLGMEDELKLNQIRHEQARRLPLPVEEVPEINRLTSQPYEVPPSVGGPIKPPLTQHLLKAGLAVLVAVPLVLFVIYWFWLPPSPEAPPIGGPTGPGPTLEALIRRWLDDHRELIACGKVSVDAVNAQTGIVSLGGRVVSEARRAEIRNGVQRIKGVTRVNDQPLQIIPRPFCEVVELLEPLQERAEGQRFGLAMRLNKTEAKPIYRRDENLVVTVQTPTAFESHVYVDYYTADAGVGHLFPNSQERKNVFRPGSAVVVGEGMTWQIQPPFGLELVTVIASKTPLFLPPRLEPESETAEAYLNVLRPALKSASEVVATFYFITTQD
jgi:type IV/VI secretion system ImpK/VasF family protein